MKKLAVLLLVLLIFTACGSDTSSQFTAENIVLNAGTNIELQGMLTMPSGAKGKVPAVVLVHGSGGHDMDETAHAYKPFKDIAEYLSANGIAVLRYDKRTFIHGTKMAENIAELTIMDETIDDAIEAATLLCADDRIDSDRIYLLGHSLGGMVAPRIDAEFTALTESEAWICGMDETPGGKFGGNFAGIIIWAGSPRTFGEILLDQLENELLMLPEDQHELGRQQIDSIKDLFAGVKDLSDAEAKEMFVLGATMYYYKDLDSHPAIDYLRDMTKPVLIMQGGKDFQVFADKDFAEYQRLLDGKDNVTFKLYPELNHFFITSTTGTGAEYMTRDNVNEEVLRDITDWIKAN